MQYYIRRWDSESQQYLFLVEVSFDDSLWLYDAKYERVLFNSVAEAHAERVKHNWSMTEIMDFEEKEKA